MDFPNLDARTVATRFGLVSIRESEPLCDRPNDNAVLFLHGLSGNSASFGWQLQDIGSDFRCIAWDAPGYGKTTIVEPRIEVYADQVGALLDALDVRNAVVVGHSMGGVVAGAVAGRFPNRVRGLVLSCTHTGYAMPPDAPMTEGHQRRVDEVSSLDPLEYGRARAADMLSPSADSAVIEIAARLASHTTPDGLQSAIKTIFRADTTHTVESTSCPTVVIAGEDDLIAPAAKTDRLASLIPDCTRILFPATGHAPYLEKPVAFNNAVRDLARRVLA